jgi:hypothetical protein
MSNHFEKIYESFRLNTLFRRFGGNDISLAAVFGVFEILHNFKTFADYATKKDETLREKNKWVIEWYKNQMEYLESGGIPVNPAVNYYLFSRPFTFISKAKKGKILEYANKECIDILRETGILAFIKRELRRIEYDKVSDKDDAGTDTDKDIKK